MAASKTSDATAKTTHKRDYVATGLALDEYGFPPKLSEAVLDQADELKHERNCRSTRITTFTLPENRRVHVVRCVDCGASNERERSR